MGSQEVAQGAAEKESEGATDLEEGDEKGDPTSAVLRAERPRCRRFFGRTGWAWCGGVSGILEGWTLL